MKKRVESKPKELKELKKLWESFKKSLDRAGREMKRIEERIKAGKLPASTQLLKNIVNTAKSQFKKVSNLSARAKKTGLSVKEPAEKQLVSFSKKLDSIATKLSKLAKKAAPKKKPAKRAVAKPKIEKKPPVEEVAVSPDVKPSEPETPPPSEPSNIAEEKH